jgi:excisionase family DNA binding protein
MRQMVQKLLQGNSVTIAPIHKELITQEAADILNVFRQYLVELLDTPVIPDTKFATHRCICFDDLMNHKNKECKIR